MKIRQARFCIHLPFSVGRGMRANVVGRNRPAFLLCRQKTPTGLSTRVVSGSLETTHIELSLEILEKWFPPFSHPVNYLNKA